MARCLIENMFYNIFLFSLNRKKNVNFTAKLINC